MFNLEDLKYAAKVIRSVRSGYVGLAGRDAEGNWYLLGYQANPTEGGGLAFEWDLEEHPYHVCPQFGNGRHIPLPLVLGEDHDVGPFQRLALRLVFPANRWIGREAMACLQDCATYGNQWDEQYPVPEPMPMDDSEREEIKLFGEETLARLRSGQFDFAE